MILSYDCLKPKGQTISTRDLDRILYSRCRGRYRRNINIHGQKGCVCYARGKTTSTRGLGSNLQIQYGGHISTLRRHYEAIVRSFSGLLICYLFRQLKPKKGTLQKKLTVNSLHCHLLKKSLFPIAFDRSYDLLVEAL